MVLIEYFRSVHCFEHIVYDIYTDCLFVAHDFLSSLCGQIKAALGLFLAVITMEGFGGLGFSDVANAVRKKRSNTSRRPRNESPLPFDNRDTMSSTPPSEDVSKLSSDDNNEYGSITQKRDINLNLCSARASFSNIIEAESAQNMNKSEGGGSGESDEASNDGSFRGSNDHRHREIDSQRSSKGALAPANWKGTNKVGPFGVVSDCSENENKVKMVKLKVGNVTRTIQAKSTSDGASAVGSSSIKSSHISDAPRPRQKLILQVQSALTYCSRFSKFDCV